MTERKRNTTVKMVVVGETMTGKTALLRRFIEHSFVPDRLKATIGADFKTKHVNLPNHKDACDMSLQIWDTAGQERFMSISNTYYRGCEGAILVYDVGCRASFEKLDYWLDELLKGTGRTTLDGFSVFVAGNKCDLPHYEISESEAAAWCNSKGLSHLHTSALTGKNVEPLFIACASTAVDYRDSMPEEDVHMLQSLSLKRVNQSINTNNNKNNNIDLGRNNRCC